MALNISEANAQVALLKQQSAAASHAARLLASYRTQLLRSWSGLEVDYLHKAINAQIRACERLSEDSDRLCHDIVQAIEEILMEEESDGENTSFI